MIVLEFVNTHTKVFLETLKQEKAWDFAPTFNLIAWYLVPLHILARLTNVKSAILWAIVGLVVSIYIVLNEPVKTAFIKWWKNGLPQGFHIVSLILWASVVFALNKAFIFSVDTKEGKLEK